jgi:glucosyl-dolichyl phosphate glucuronosyltransferase
MFVSVLICTRNRAASLRRTLDSLFHSSNIQVPEWEAVVVDNDSIDDTPGVCNDFREKFPQKFRFLVEKKHGKSNALNTGIAAAKGDILAFTDDDVLCASDYIRGLRTVFTIYSADAAQGRVLLDCEDGLPAWLGSTNASMANFRDLGDEVIDLDGTMCGINMIVRAEVFPTIAGFAPELGPNGVGMWEDTETLCGCAKPAVA